MNPSTEPGHPFRLLPEGNGRPVLAAVASIAARVLGLGRLAALHAEVGVQPEVQSYVRRCLDVLGVATLLPEGDLERIPETGPVVVVANHPFGALEGLLILHMLLAVRPDVKILGNHLLGRFTQLRPVLIAVDPFGGEGATRRNGRPLKDAVRWVEAGHALVVFPAGEVATRRRGEHAVTDPEWNPNVGRIVRRTLAPVLPVFFEGDNGRLFHLAGRIHPLLRTALLPRALLDRRGTTVRLRVGRMVEGESVTRFTDDRECVDYLRLRTMVLGRSLADEARSTNRLVRLLRPRPRTEALIEPIEPALLAADLASLPDTSRLVVGERLETWIAEASQIPHVLQEIGRLREKTFRAIGEGTGRSIDLDRYDEDYLHLFLWDRAQSQVVGAYRLGRTDRLLARGGRDALYTNSLFELDPAFVEHVTPGLELGRSFVREEHQRSFLPLLQLWRGIGAFIVRHPHYQRLFGPVSISATYGTASRELMVDHLREHEFLPEFAALVKPRRPLRAGVVKRYGLRWTRSMLQDLGDVSTMVTEMERDAKGVPVLIREYLKLGGKIVGFNVDQAFADVVDGLVLVDLTETEPRLLARYMGKPGAAHVTERWRTASQGLLA